MRLDFTAQPNPQLVMAMDMVVVGMGVVDIMGAGVMGVGVIIEAIMVVVVVTILAAVMAVVVTTPTVPESAPSPSSRPLPVLVRMDMHRRCRVGYIRNMG